MKQGDRLNNLDRMGTAGDPVSSLNSYVRGLLFNESELYVGYIHRA